MRTMTSPGAMPDRRVRLDVVVHRIRATTDYRAHDALRHGLADAEGIAHREHHVADRDLIDVGERNGLQSDGVDPEKREVRSRVGADELRKMDGSIRQRNGEVGSVRDDVVIRDDVSIAFGERSRFGHGHMTVFRRGQASCAAAAESLPASPAIGLAGGWLRLRSMRRSNFLPVQATNNHSRPPTTPVSQI